jgi:NAD(P)-dependent dehydrogenase (short-subunit alcohol dehydrogenase family)
MNEKLANKVCLITGATSGIGEESAKELNKMGAEIIFIARNEEKGNRLKQELQNDSGREATMIIADLSSQAEVKKAANEFLALNKPLDILLNNAGIMNRERNETVDGFEEVFSVNHLAYYTFSLLLAEKLKETKESRVINVASGAHQFVKDMNFEDLQSEETFKPMQVYGQSKLANILFTKSLAKKLSDFDVTVNCLHPGFVSTGIGSNNKGVWNFLMFLAKPFARKTDKGAETSIFLCSSSEVKDVSGEYFVDCKIEKVSKAANSTEQANQLWEISSKLTGLDLQ